MDWVYGQAIGFLGNFFALMGNMGVELFELEWVSAIILFFSRLAWALFTVSVVVCAFECGIEYSTGRGNLQQCGMNIIKGFLAVSLFTVVPVRLYALSVSLQGTFSAGLTGYGRSIGEVGQDIITELNEIQTLSDVVNSSHFGLGIITSPIMLLFCVILMGYAVLKVFFANLKRGGILLIQIAVGSLYMFSVPRGYLDGFMGWVRQVIGLCLTAFLQSTSGQHFTLSPLKGNSPCLKRGRGSVCRGTRSVLRSRLDLEHIRAKKQQSETRTTDSSISMWPIFSSSWQQT